MQTEIQTSPSRRIVDIETAAEHCGLSRKTLYSYVSARRVPHIKLGRAVRFDLGELDRWLDEHKVAPIGGRRR